MASEARAKSPSHRTSRTGAAITLTLVFGVAAALALLSPVAAASTYLPEDPISWSNGVVLCQFAAASPSVAVSHLGVEDTGVTVALTGLTELTPAGTSLAAAELTGIDWKVSNLSTDDAYDLAYSATAPLVSPSGATTVTGSVEVLVQFVLPAYEGSDVGPTNQVAVLMSVINWTWQNASDHLELSFAVSPSFPASEHLNTTGARGWLLASTSNSSGQVLEQVGANLSAKVVPVSGSTTTVAASPSLGQFSPSWAEVSVEFGSSAGTYSSLTYVAQVGVVTPTEVAGIPVSELAAAAAAGVLVSLVVAAVARRIRRRPSKFIYVTEEEEP